VLYPKAQIFLLYESFYPSIVPDGTIIFSMIRIALLQTTVRSYKLRIVGIPVLSEGEGLGRIHRIPGYYQ
jgi:hypothetical protein